MSASVSERWVPAALASQLQELVDTFPEARPTADLQAFSDYQSEYMLTKLFLEQAQGGGMPGATCEAVVRRDFGSLEELRRQWDTLVDDERVEWIVVGLSYADFRFHVFPVGSHSSPFCVSPVISACVSRELRDAAGLDSRGLVDLQWGMLNWKCHRSALRLSDKAARSIRGAGGLY